MSVGLLQFLADNMAKKWHWQMPAPDSLIF